MGQPLLCVVRPYLIKEFIKRVLILNLNIHHALKEITHNILKITSQYISKDSKHITKKHQQGINQVYSSCSSIKKVHHAHQPSQMHVHVIMYDLSHISHYTITPQHLCINAGSNFHECSCDSSKHKP